MKLFLFTIFLLSLLSAQTSVYGGRGLFRVLDAEGVSPGKLIFSIKSIYYPQDQRHRFDLLFPNITYAPIEYLEFAGFYGGIFEYKKNSFKRGFYDGLIATKLSMPFLPVVKLGANISYGWPRKDMLLFYPYAVLPQKGLSYAFLGKIKLRDFWPMAPDLVFERGWLKAKDEKKADIVWNTLGSGIVLEAERLKLFSEIFIEAKKGENLFGLAKNRVKITPGISIILSNFIFDFSVSLGRVFKKGLLPDYSFNLGISYASYFLRPPEVLFGHITGRVIDEKTGLPLKATISLPNLPKYKPVTTDPNTGVYSLYKIPEGTVVLEVSADGYYREAIVVVVKGKTTLKEDIALRPLMTYGVVAGRVYDKTTNKPLFAKVTIQELGRAPIYTDSLSGSFRIDSVPTGFVTIETEKEKYFPLKLTVSVKVNEVSNVDLPLTPKEDYGYLTGVITDYKTKKPLAGEVEFVGTGITVKSDTLTGVYKAELPVGSYAALVKAEGYIPQSQAVIIERDKTNEKNFSLVALGMAITLRGVYFEFNKATIKPESYPVLDEAAKILVENPKIMVEVQGHTDNIGSSLYNKKLSERRAYAVVNYFVQRHGIDINRLKAVGYGPTKPIADNSTEEGRALNRRVEFVVLGEKKE